MIFNKYLNKYLINNIKGLVFIPFFIFSISNANQIDSFEKAKKVLPSIFAFHGKTFYCDCPYSLNGKRLEIGQCATYTPRNKYTKNGKLNERAIRIEWEHIVPAENFGRQFEEWRNGHKDCIDSKGNAFKGRQCAKKMNKKFRAMESDLRNLVPAIGEVNADRSNFRFAENRDYLGGGNYGKCEFRADFNERKAYVRNDIKGLIARTYLYFVENYNMSISKQDLSLYKYWDKTYPANAFEKEWLRRVEMIKAKFQNGVEYDK